MLERERELGSLEALLADSLIGRGGVAVIEGDAGVGKSTLLRAARERAGELGVRVLRARGSELEQGYAFGVAIQLLGEAPVAAALARGGLGGYEPDAATLPLGVILALYDALLDIVRAPGGGANASPVLVTVDDAQWVDVATLRFLAHLAVRIEGQPLALVYAVRSDDASARGELLYRLRESPAVRVLTPASLSEEAAAVVVSAMLGERSTPELAAACFHATAGNPFYLQELLRALAAEHGQADPSRVGELAPRAVLRSVVVRLARLGGPAGGLARAAAVLGDGAALTLAGALAGMSETDAETAAEALMRGAILERAERLSFVHPLIASALEADMGSFERARMHRRAAELLRSDGAATERVAAHLLVARPQGEDWTVDVLKEAASRAARRGAPEVAVRLLHRALVEPPTAEKEPDLLLACARAEAVAGSPAAAERLEQALGRIEIRESRIDALVESATLAHLQGQFARVAELARRARAELEPDHPRQEQLLGVELSAAALEPSLAAAMEERIQPLLARARAGQPPSDPRLLVLVIAWLARSDPPETVRALARPLIEANPLIDDSHGASVGWLASALLWTNELELADSWLRDVVDAADRSGAVIPGAIGALNRATVCYHCGRLDEAVADGERALEIYRYGWTSWPWSTPVLAVAHVARGDLVAAREAIAIGEPAGSDPPDHALLLEARAKLEMADGQPAAALASARALGELVTQRAPVAQPRSWEWRRLAAMAAHRQGDDEQALELIAPDLEALRQTGPARQLGAALTVAGLAVGGEDGVDLLAEATDVQADSPAQLQRAETMLWLGSALRRAGRRTAAKEWLCAALESAAEMGAAPLSERTRAEMNRLGLRPRRAAQSGPASLTPSERQVAALAADGLTTLQLAERLCITRHTVETHLTHIYRKLDVRGRRELGQALARGNDKALQGAGG